MRFPGIFLEPEAEDSLENTFSCVPKVQGESRISQANGRRCFIDKLCAFSGQSCGDCPFLFVNFGNEVFNYARKDPGFYRICGTV